MQRENEGTEMADEHFPVRNTYRLTARHHDSGAEVQYLLRAEEQLLHSISARMPLAEILQQICDALNAEIGNVISLASLPNDNADGLATIVKSAGIFGLHKFCSAPVVGGNDEALGSIEMYCCVPRRPFLGEISLIERATCLAAIAIKRHNATRDAV
jgi:GAF domain-containing protein